MKAPTKLTVIIRDDFPMIQCGDCPSYRVVTIELTDEQRRALILNKTGNITEDISKAILG